MIFRLLRNRHLTFKTGVAENKINKKRLPLVEATS